MFTLRGSLIPFLQNETYDFDPSRGYIYHADFKGISRAQMTALQQDYVNAGIACRLAYRQGGMSTLDIEDATQSYTIDVWEIESNGLTVDIFSHPNALSNATPDQIAAIRAYLEQQSTPDVAFADNGAGAGSKGVDLTPLAGGVIQRFYSLNQRGSTDYRRSHYILKHTTNAPARWTQNVSDNGVDAIYTPAQLLSEVSNAGLWIFPIPDRLYYKINNIPIPAPQANYQWGWLKSGSTETTAANNRVNIVTQYELEQWSTDLYIPD